jgi:hypothetical protein
MIPHPRWPLVVFVLCTGAFAAQPAHGRKSKLVSYALEVVYPTCIRYIRIDRNWPIAEKDQEGGYIIFTYIDKSGKRSRAAVELIRRGKEKAAKTRIVVTIGAAPAYVENEFLDKLANKLKQEHRR